ncbi:hypothetical protein BKA63DRAFT_436113 [Paraphoma chrysanthemicola]|nr:hypothetical protein BKA63DRAFT_436113 [Paraphoma chrysanthemicola]
MSSIDPFPDTVVGYPKLAAKIESLPETAMFRRFGALNAQNLLYYQAELTYLELKLQTQQHKDQNLGTVREKSYATDWFWLERARQDGDATQLNLIMKIRTLLKEYNELLIQQSTILQYADPGKWDLDHIQQFLQRPENGELALRGEDSTIWGSVTDPKSYKPDLVALRPRAREDPFSRWAAQKTDVLRWLCARFVRPSRKHGVFTYKDSTIYKITHLITVIVAALIPIASIVVLNDVQSMSSRLGVIAAFNVLISVCLIGFADAKREQVFAINAAFAAVQVVFVGQDKCLVQS